MAQLCCVERSTIFNERYSQKWDVIGSRGSGVSKCSGRPIFIFFFIKENWICAMNRHHTEPNNNIDNKSSFWLDVRQWSHPLMIPLHCLWANSSNSMRGQFECNVLVFLFWFCLFTMRLLFLNLFTFSSCANKRGLLQNEY